MAGANFGAVTCVKIVAGAIIVAAGISLLAFRIMHESVMRSKPPTRPIWL